MIVVPQPAAEISALAWYGLAAVTSYYLVIGVGLRWRRRREVRVAKYEPPAGVSPAIASFLRERGVSDKPFVVALINMAAKEYLRIEQGPSDYLLSLANVGVPLEAEENLIAQALFPAGTRSAYLSGLANLESIASSVRDALESVAEPDLVSTHFSWLLPGLVISLWCFLAAMYAEMQGLHTHLGAPIVIPIFFAVWALLGMIKTAPATLYKVKSFFPGRSPHPMRFDNSDRTPALMFLIAMVCLGVIGWATSVSFAMLFGACVAVNAAGSMALRSPTGAGYALLDELDDFRMFFAEVDSDRVNRVNVPTALSGVPDKYWAWALALNMEHAWGEQFAAALLNRLGPDAAMDTIQTNLPEGARAREEILDLRLH